MKAAMPGQNPSEMSVLQSMGDVVVYMIACSRSGAGTKAVW